MELPLHVPNSALPPLLELALAHLTTRRQAPQPLKLTYRIYRAASTLTRQKINSNKKTMFVLEKNDFLKFCF
jgi:hypothetical protein